MSKKHITFTDFLLTGSGDNEGAQNDGRKETIELLDKLTEQIFSKNNIDIKTVLNKRQVYAFSLAKIYANAYDIEIIKEFIELLSIYAVSEGGLSRKQFTDLAKSIMSYQVQEEQAQKDLPSHLLGQ